MASTKVELQVRRHTLRLIRHSALVLVTSDLDVYQDVFVRKYENFHGRKEFPLAKDPDQDKYSSMFHARGLRWKRLRAISTPVFSVKNMRKVTKRIRGLRIVNDCL